MKLLLCSEGFHTPNTVKACVDLVGKPQNEISFAIINEAYTMQHDDKRWVLHNLNCVADNFPAKLDIVNLLALPITEVEKRIMAKDAIFVVGGNNDYLMHVFTKTGFDKLLPHLLKSKIYVGSSAGSMVMGKRLSEAAYNTMYEELVWPGVTQYLELVNFSFMPHLDSPHRPDRKAKLEEAAKQHDTKIYGLRDDSAIIINGDHMEFTGSKPYEFNS